VEGRNENTSLEVVKGVMDGRYVLAVKTFKKSYDKKRNLSKKVGNSHSSTSFSTKQQQILSRGRVKERAKFVFQRRRSKKCEDRGLELDESVKKARGTSNEGPL